MGGRTLPTECEHGVIVDWGDFGPCRDCSEHGDTEDCPYTETCAQCDARFAAERNRLAEDLAIAARVRACRPCTSDASGADSWVHTDDSIDSCTIYAGTLLRHLLAGPEEKHP